MHLEYTLTLSAEQELRANGRYLGVTRPPARTIWNYQQVPCRLPGRKAIIRGRPTAPRTPATSGLQCVTDLIHQQPCAVAVGGRWRMRMRLIEGLWMYIKLESSLS